MPFCETHEGRLFVAQRGKESSSLPLVLLHGAGGTHHHWGLHLRNLSTSKRVLALDLPGHGRSPGAGRSSIADYSAVVVAALAATGLERVALAGHSMGGAVALWTTLAAPERVAALALVSSGGRLPVLPALFEHLERGEPAAAVRLIAQRAYGRSAPPELRETGEKAFLQTDPQVLHGDLRACAGHNVMARLGEVACPTLVLCGDDDQVTPLKFSRSLAEGITGARLVVLPGAGHMALLEQPEAVGAALHNWIRAAECS